VIRTHLTPTDVDGVRTPEGAVVPDYYLPPAGPDFYTQPTPVRPEWYRGPIIHVDGLANTDAVVDCVPELVYRCTWLADGSYQGDVAGHDG
jgi:hypothetical protein